MSDRTSGARRFTVTGEGLTRLARGFVLEDEPQRGYLLLADGLMVEGDDKGASARVALAVLRGESCLLGDSNDGIAVESDPDAADYLNRVRWLYAGRLRVRGRWYRPRAVVAEFGYQDGHYATKQTDGVPDAWSSRQRQWARARIEAYAYQGELVLSVENHTLSDEMIFEPCGEPPHWMRPAADASEAYQRFLDVGRDVEKLTHAEVFGGEEPAMAMSKGRVLDDTEQDVDDPLGPAPGIAQCAEWRRKILEQAGPDTIEIKDREGKVHAEVPRVPFEAYALARTSMAHLRPWTTVCPSGLKMGGDSPLHTDWYVGAGFDSARGYDYDGLFHEAAFYTMCKVQSEFTRSECAVIVDGPAVEGTVGREIVVLPNLAPEQLPKLVGARAVVTETGGQLAHLALVALERSIPIVRLADATARFREGMRVCVCPAECLVRVIDLDVVDGL